MIGLLGVVLAATPSEEAMRAEMIRARATIANQIHLMAFDLLDELVAHWLETPLFDAPTPVILGGITVPVGLGTGLEAELENHLVAALVHHPTTGIELVHCPACTAVTVHSTPRGTVVARGVDDPAVLEVVGRGSGKHALFVDIEAEGSFRVLRARITRLTPELPIVWAHTLTSSTTSAAMLREPTRIKSVEEAREEYLAALRGRGRIRVPFRIGMRTYAQPWDVNRTGPPPFLWVQGGIEMGFTDARVWTSSLVLGYSFIPEAYQGLLLEGRVHRLVTGRARSLTRPDLYIFGGTAVITVWGPATVPFQGTPATADDVLAAARDEGPRTTFGSLQVGAEVRLGNRIGFASFLEHNPSLARTENLGSYLYFLGTAWHTFGAEVSFCF